MSPGEAYCHEKQSILLAEHVRVYPCCTACLLQLGASDHCKAFR
eukprot:Gb_24859 [translate_table: standard]